MTDILALVLVFGTCTHGGAICGGSSGGASIGDTTKSMHDANLVLGTCTHGGPMDGGSIGGGSIGDTAKPMFEFNLDQCLAEVTCS